MSAEIPNKPASSAPAPNAPKSMDAIMALCKRRGFIYQSSEIYGGCGGVWDYGPLGAELKRNLRTAWWNTMTREREDVLGLDASILMNPAIWKASGTACGPLVRVSGRTRRNAPFCTTR